MKIPLILGGFMVHYKIFLSYLASLFTITAILLLSQQFTGQLPNHCHLEHHTFSTTDWSTVSPNGEQFCQLCMCIQKLS